MFRLLEQLMGRMTVIDIRCRDPVQGEANNVSLYPLNLKNTLTGVRRAVCRRDRANEIINRHD